MYLKRLELKGFKSFYNKTIIDFKEGITSVVGPNGSGKSNISDSVRWLLGEQSIKSLRGDKLEDVIFAGTSNKKPLSYCEASLTIENEDRIIDIDYSEVNIKRRVYRSGESQFFINNKPCRLKDVKELFLDTGIGKEGYSIIEQGKIDEILSGSVGNRRKIFEEAAGISKYRYKKEESQKKLKNTFENLERINDVYEEIKGQLKPLQEQKQKAQKFIELKEQLKEIDLNKQIKDYKKFEEDYKKLDEIKNNLIKNLDNINEKRENLSKFKLEYEQKLNDIQLKKDELNKSILFKKEEIDNIKNKIEILKIERKNESQKQEENEKELLGIKNLNNDSNENTKKLSFQVQMLNSELEKLKVELVKKEELKENYLNILDKLQRDLEDNKEQIIKLINEKNKKNVNKSTIIERASNLNNSKNILEDEIKVKKTELDDVINQSQLIDEKLKNSITLKIQDDLSLENKNKDLKENKEKLYNLEEEINKDNIKRENIKSKLNVYKHMQDDYEGFNKGVKNIMKNKSLKGIEGTVLDIINTNKRYEKAIESSLASTIQNIIVKDEICAKEAISYLKRNSLGKVTFLPLNIIKGRKLNLDLSKIDGVIGIASDLITYDDKYKNIVEYLLGRIIIVENIDKAIKISKDLNYKYKLVTLDAEVFNAGGAITGGHYKNERNILSRKRIINDLNTDLENINAKINDSLIKKDEFKEKIVLKKEEILSLENKIEDLKTSINELKNKEEILKTKFDEIKTYLDKKEKDVIDYKKTIEIYQADIKAIELDLSNYDEKSYEIDNIINEVTKKVENKKEKIDVITKEISNLNINYSVVNEKLIGLNKEIENILLSKTKNDLKIEEIKKKIQVNKFNIERSIEVKKELDIKLESENINFEELNKEEENLNSLILKIKEDNEANIKDEKDIEQQYISLKEKTYKNEASLEKNQERIVYIKTYIKEEYDLEYEDCYEFYNEELDIKKKDIDELKVKINNLGNVNLDSIEQFKEVNERHIFYSEQKEDLEKSIKELESIIRSMESSMKKEFKLKFEEINNNFKDVFVKLFGGGYGELQIVDENDILESDIKIIAQPPGKKLKNISLMSGGEKALTAISILFSILLSKDTPFCILDEIEAPLDDANIYRFGKFLKELSKETQFIAITHRRGTMEVSDFIYGITMEEKGISKVIGLRLEEAKEYTD
ncbi:chromosome segregation protein SMC [Peptostreptococcaceae bacterium AGR-M142]